VICSGTLYYPEIEVCEGLYPIFWHRWEWAEDSAGPGRWRGGLGVHNEWEAMADPEPVYVNYAADPFDYTPAPAIAGGKMPPPNTKELYMADGTRVTNQEVKEAKFFVLKNGDRARDFVQGGCGVGNPLERPAELVAKDVRDGLVSVECAARDYGVVVDPETFRVDEEKTRSLR
jgi:N-methylhydantoinase B